MDRYLYIGIIQNVYKLKLVSFKQLNIVLERFIVYQFENCNFTFLNR